jgi:hypothetical protein
MHKRHRGADCTQLPHDLLRLVLQFVIGGLRTWHMLLQVSKQFKQCVLDPPSLKHVKVAMDQHFDRLRSVPGLRTLRLNTNSVDSVMAELQRYPPASLQSLDLTCRDSTPEDSNLFRIRDVRGGTITNQGLTEVACIRTLTAVDLTNCAGISDVGIRALAPLAGTLRTLNLSGCTGITNQTLGGCQDTHCGACI